jgi:hypothetical protein
MTSAIHREPPASHIVTRVLATIVGALLALAAAFLLGLDAALLREAVAGQTGDAAAEFENMLKVSQDLAKRAIYIVVIIAPLAFCWGVGAMAFGSRNGPQIMASAIVAVVLIAGVNGIAA